MHYYDQFYVKYDAIVSLLSFYKAWKNVTGSHVILLVIDYNRDSEMYPI